MTGVIVILIVVLLAVIAVQIGKVSDLAKKIRGEEEVEQRANDRQANWMLVFMVAFLGLVVGSIVYYKDSLLGYGPLQSASAHGGSIDSIVTLTFVFTFIVFILTHILLFWYAYKYRSKKGERAKFISHNNTLELVWTLVPAIALTFLVVKGLVAWNEIMPDVSPDDNYMEIEATGYQFAWDIRYSGADGKLGTKDFRLIDPASNPLGIDWTDDNSMDDIVLGGADKIVLPVDTTVRVRITSKDVLHNFYLPHFRVKMDAVPGLPTYFVFKPIKTTEEFRQELRSFPEYNEPYDPEDPESAPRWKEFNYELACAELCGKGHYSMRRIIEVVTREQYEEWLAGQKSYYLNSIRGTDADPRKGGLLEAEIEARKVELKADFEKAISSDDEADKTIILKHVFYNTGSASLSDLSRYELDNLVSLMNSNPDVSVELAGHTDNQGAADANITLSEQRAQNVYNYLSTKGVDASRMTAKGYGDSEPLGDNATEEGRVQNRRTELRIKSK